MNEVNETQMWRDYQDGLAWQAAAGLSREIPSFVNFYEGRQWPKATEATKNMPRPVINIVKMICRNKKSAILSKPVKIVYRADDAGVDIGRFNRFSDYILKEMAMDEIDKRAIDDGVKKGTYIYHFYWDAEATGKDGMVDGGLRCEIIDPLNIFFSNPNEHDEQKQKWILIASREDVDAVRAKADRDIDAQAITPDTAESRYGETEQDGTRLCTVLTRYFRRGGEVYCEKATRGTIVNRPFSLAPDFAGARLALGLEAADEESRGAGMPRGQAAGLSALMQAGILSGRAGGQAEMSRQAGEPNKAEDAPNNALPDAGGDRIAGESARCPLYPIVVGNYERRENSIYGIGEIEGIIPNQKAINFNIAMALLNAQEMAWGKYIALPGALRGQRITNEPGQVLVDYSNTGSGIRKMSEAGASGQPMSLVEALTSLTRTVTGSTEVMTGEVVSSSMSGAAIAQLQSQAQQPIEELRDAWWKVKEKQGKVLAQYYRHYYAEREYTYQEEDGAAVQTDLFSGADYAGAAVDVIVEATSGTKASAAGDINILDVLLSKGLISLKTYFKAYPADALSNRSEILKGIEEDQQSELTVLREQAKTYETQLAEATSLLAKQKETVDNAVSAIRETSQLKSLIVNLRAEAAKKIREANTAIGAANAAAAEANADAIAFAGEILKGGVENRGMSEVQNSGMDTAGGGQSLSRVPESEVSEL